MKWMVLVGLGLLGVAGCSDSGSSGAAEKCPTPEEMLRCDKVLNIAHRGGRLIRPEHAIVAYDQALVDGIMTDDPPLLSAVIADLGVGN